MSARISSRLPDLHKRHSSEPESEIFINGVRLTSAQAMSVRVAVSSFRMQLSEPEECEALGAIGPLYDERLSEVELHLVKDWSVRKARRFAEEKHAGQTYNAGQDPYTVHLDAVHDVAESVGLDEEIRVAAYLHDVLEDTPVGYKELAEKFSEQVAQLVEAVTGRGGSRQERNKDAYHKIIETGARAAHLKLCDRIVNAEFSKRFMLGATRDYYALYKKENPSFMTMINMALTNANDEERRTARGVLVSECAGIIERQMLQAFRSQQIRVFWPDKFVTESTSLEQVLEAFNALAKTRRLALRLEARCGEGHTVWDGPPEDWMGCTSSGYCSSCEEPVDADTSTYLLGVLSDNLDAVCVGLHATAVEATYSSPQPLCDECWFRWFTEGYTDEERALARVEHEEIVRVWKNHD